VLDRFAGYKRTRRPTPIKDLAEKYQRNQAIIARMTPKAFREGLVEVTPRFPTDHLPRVKELEYPIQLAFPKLKTVTVVEGEEDQDHLYKLLGRAAAHMIAAPATLLREEDVLAVGSGRGVYCTATSLIHDFRQPAMRIGRLTLVSLTGSVYSSQRETVTWVDSDFNSALLRAAIDPRASVILHTVARPLLPNTDREATHLDKSKWPHLTLALIGVGVLSEGRHRFYEQARTTQDRKEPTLAPIDEDLEELVALVETLPKQSGYAVGDVSNHLFLAGPESDPTDNKTKETVTQLRQKIESINSQMLNFEEEQLRPVPAILVAGSAEKALVISHLCHRFNVQFLCVDTSAARAMLELRS
jgi:DNA-binding transcriptional regulator LsrR (DeoR family)